MVTTLSNKVTTAGSLNFKLLVGFERPGHSSEDRRFESSLEAEVSSDKKNMYDGDSKENQLGRRGSVHKRS